jgi:diguanylate cyclase (GGDEF)-like protein/PAS domain S-box-containing protein
MQSRDPAGGGSRHPPVGGTALKFPRRAADFALVSTEQSAQQREDVLATLLAQPRAIVVAIASDGVLVPMPASLEVAQERVLEAPADRATLLDVVVPADNMTVITAWERAREQGLALATVHLRSDPDQPLTLTFVDARQKHGVFVGGLDAVPREDGDALGWTLQPDAVFRRPRTATVRKTTLAVLTDVDDRTTSMLGWTAEQMVGKRSTEFIHPDDQERAIANWMELLSRQEAQRVRLRHRCADGSWAWLELENQYLAADDPADAVVVTHMSDISDEMAAHEALQQRERLLRRVAESLPVGILQLGADGGLVFTNSRLATMLGLPEVTGLADLETALDEEDRPRLRTALTQSLHADTDGELEVRLTPAGATAKRVCAVSLVSLGGWEGTPGALLSLSDITDSVRMREELRAKATFDVLTGCHNRSSTLTILEQALHGPDGDQTAVVFVDLDRFKPVNDMLGHDAGDELLILTANRLAGVLRRDDIVGRLGGDEFLVVARGLDTPDAAAALGERIRAALSGPAVLQGGPVDLQASIGVARAADEVDAAELIKRADRAMYLSKQQGRGQPVLFG